jgi:hypothetical protein
MTIRGLSLRGRVMSLALAVFIARSGAATGAMSAMSGLHPSVDVAAVSAAAAVPPMPRKPSMLPPTYDEWRYDLAPSDKLRPELMTPEMRRDLRERGN